MWNEIEALKARVAELALECAKASNREHLHQRNAMRQADGARLQEAIRQILVNHPGPGRMSAKHVLRALEGVDIPRNEPPKLRTVQWHIRAIRNTSALR